MNKITLSLETDNKTYQVFINNPDATKTDLELDAMLASIKRQLKADL